MKRSTLSATALLLGLAPILLGQVFDSGSDGSDGPLSLTTPGEIVFDPRAFPIPLDQDGDNIYHFTTIDIAEGVVVKFRANVVNGPVYWLAQGAVAIDGALDLNGEVGHPATSQPAIRLPSTPGSGGYAGGVGRFGSSPVQDGFGPGGGTIFPGGPSCSGIGRGGSFTGNAFLVPLIGGSGGAGSPYTNDGGGGAGGGAIVIASSSSITISGSISANGGMRGSNFAGSGSGGAIRLVAPLLAGNGTLATNGIGRAPDPCAGGHAASSGGLIRMEAFSSAFTGIASGTVRWATPFSVFLPVGLSSLRVVSIGGTPVPSNPAGSFDIPDVLLDASTAVPVVVEARNVAIGTLVSLQIFSEGGPDQTTEMSPLEGMFELSTASTSVVLPPGYSRGLVRASWIE